MNTLSFIMSFHEDKKMLQQANLAYNVFSVRELLQQVLFEEMTEINSDKSMYELIKNTALPPEFLEENAVLQTLQVME